MFILDQMWAGDEATYQRALKLEANLPQALEAYSGEETIGTYQVSEDGVAVINVHGTLLNAEIPDDLARAFGITTYPSLQKAFTNAANDDSVNKVVLDVNSGGGQVSGIQDTLEALDSLRTTKSVSTYVSDGMYSAAYWIGSNSDSITMSDMGGAGSIGVITVHTSVVEAAAKEGVSPTVIRAGKFKALGHHLEEFTAEAKGQIQEHVDFVYQNFVGAVAKHRKVPHEVAQYSMSEGKVFYGKKALEAGLVDNLGSFNSFMAGVQSKTTSVNHSGGFAAKSGEVSMELKDMVDSLQAQLTTSEAELSLLKEVKSQLEATNASLAKSLTETTAHNEKFAEVLDTNISTLAVALNAEAIIPKSLGDKQELLAVMQAKFSERFPSGGVAAVNQNISTKTAIKTPEWLHNVVKTKE